MTAAAVLLVSSCGNEAEPLSKAELIEQGDAICQAATDELEPVWDEYWADFGEDFDFDDPANADRLFTGIAELMGITVPRWQQQSEELRELVPPREDSDLVEQLLTDFEAAVDEMETLADAIAAGDEKARQRIETDDDPLADVNRRARDYGFVVCGADEA